MDCGFNYSGNSSISTLFQRPILPSTNIFSPSLLKRQRTVRGYLATSFLGIGKYLTATLTMGRAEGIVAQSQMPFCEARLQHQLNPASSKHTATPLVGQSIIPSTITETYLLGDDRQYAQVQHSRKIANTCVHYHTNGM